MDFIFLIGRIMFAFYFLNSGINHFTKMPMVVGYAASKGVWHPKTSVVISGLLLLLGSVGIILGAYIGVAVLFLTLFLIPVSFEMHAYWRETDPQAKMMEKMNFLRNVAFLGGLILLLFIQYPWPYALNLVYPTGY